MLKNALLILVALAIAIGGGAASVWHMLAVPDGVGAVAVGGWTAFPDLGTPDADPYSKARVAREGVLAIGRAEGLVLIAQHDAGGEPLLANCTYLVEGTLPPARFWTLHAADERLGTLATTRRGSALHSLALLRQPDNSLAISVGPHPAPGNWLAVAGKGPMRLVLMLYDTPIAGSAGLADVKLPHVVKVRCDA